MAGSSVFDWVSQELERRTAMRLIEARGTVRLVLKQAGLEAATVTATQMQVVLIRLMPKALAARHVDDAEALCGELARHVHDATVDQPAPAESAYDVFRRLGRDEDKS